MSDTEMMFPMSPWCDQSPREQSPKRDTEAEAVDEDAIMFQENKEKDTIEFDHRKLLRLMTQFTMGYDPNVLPGLVDALYPTVWEGMFPGSYNHLLVILFSSMADMEICQINMHNWMRNNFPFKHRTTLSKYEVLDETIFGSELEMLKRLLVPVRLNTVEEVFWLNTRRLNSAELAAQTCHAMDVLEQLRRDILDTLAKLVDFGKTSKELE